jgi:chemotaxis protein histidine kinase CheA
MNSVEQPAATVHPVAFLSGAPGPWAGHLPFAYDLVAAIKPRLIVELGVYFGDSYFGLCQAVTEHGLVCTCYGVDTWKGESNSATDEDSVYEAVSRHNEQNYRSFSYLERKTFNDALAQFSDRTVGLLHIAGLRTYEAAQRDFQNWLPKVRPGGVILLSDIAQRSRGYGVWRLWEELQCKFPNFAFRHNNGLGVLWKPDGPDENNAFLRELFSSSKENQERIRRYYCLCSERLELEHKLGLSRADREKALAEARAAHESELEEQRKAHLVAIADFKQLQASHQQLSEDVAIERHNVEDLKAEVERLTTEQEELRLESLELRRINARLATALNQERMLRSSMEHSSSWQLTKPLRAVGDIFKPSGRR